MKDPNQDVIDALYSGFDYSESSDPDAEALFNGLVKALITLDTNKQKLFFHVFRSSFGKIWSCPSDDEEMFSILWDTTQWELFDSFLDVIISATVFDSLSPPIFSEKHCAFQVQKLIFHSFSYFYEKYQNNYIFRDFFRKVKEQVSLFSNVPNCFTDIMHQTKQELLFYAKMFVLLHEFEHILTRLCPEIHAHDLHFLLDQFLCDQIEYTKDCQKVRGMPIQEYHAGLNKLINPPSKDWEDQKEEIYGDLHAFTEMIACEKYNKAIKDHIENIPAMIISVKTYCMFRTFITIPEFLVDQFNEEYSGTITHDQLNKNMKEFEEKEIELRQATLYDMTMAYYKYYTEEDKAVEGTRIFTGMMVSSFISTYRKSIQPLIMSFQEAIHNYYFYSFMEGSK